MEYKHKMMDYSGFPIFHGINEGSLTRMMACFRVRQSVYEPGAVVREYDGNRREVGIVTEGAADLVRIDYGGTRTILEHLEVGSIFGEVLAFTVQTGDSISVVTDSGCRVMYMDYDHIMKRCENACQHHSQLVQNLFSLVTEQMQQKKPNPPIKNEADNGLRNTRGTIAMARTADKDSATSQFFINVADNAFLDHGQRDFGYAVFGKVVKGMDVADKISQVPTHDVGPYQNVPSKPVVILSAKVLP